MVQDASYWISKLNMLPHPEGGYYHESFRSNDIVRLGEPLYERSAVTSIYFLLENGDKSHFHRLKHDELWYFHAGGPLQVHIIYPDGRLEQPVLGTDLEAGQHLQIILEAGTWFAATPLASYTLIGCAVAPGFDFQDFELAKGAELSAAYPVHTDLINTYSAC